MKINDATTDAAILAELGQRLTAVRLAQDWTQAQLAEQAGVSKRTVERLEAGAVAVQLSALLRVCRALGLLPRLDSLLPEAGPSPVARLKLEGKTRKRASRRVAPTASKPPWTWNQS